MVDIPVDALLHTFSFGPRTSARGWRRRHPHRRRERRISAGQYCQGVGFLDTDLVAIVALGSVVLSCFVATLFSIYTHVF